MRLLVLEIHEPLPGMVLPLMASHHGGMEAARRYRAIVITLLRQLRGLAHTRIRIRPVPDDAADALRFWLLPRLAHRWHDDAGVFRSDGWEIDFAGNDAGYQIVARGDALCPFLGARWVHTAMLGLERRNHHVTGPACGGGVCFHAAATGADPGLLEERRLPELPVIHTDSDWQSALQSALGPALKRAWDEEQ